MCVFVQVEIQNIHWSWRSQLRYRWRRLQVTSWASRPQQSRVAAPHLQSEKSSICLLVWEKLC